MNTVPALGIVLDCRDPQALASFWAAALGYVIAGSVDNYTLLLPDGRPGTQLLLQRVSEPKPGKNRMHIDLKVPDIAAIETTAAGLEQIGARRLNPAVISEYGNNWLLMADPEGNEFCVCDGGGTSTA